RQSRSVDFGSVVGRNRQRCLIDCQRARGKRGEAVVGGRERADGRRDGPRSRVGLGVGGGGVGCEGGCPGHHRGILAVHESGNGRRKGRKGRTVRDGQVVRRDRQRRLVHCQDSRSEDRNRIVRRGQRTGRRRDAPGSGIGISVGCGGVGREAGSPTHYGRVV